MGVVNERGDVPYIGVGGGNIEIAPQHQRLIWVTRLVFHMPGQGIKPPELIVVMSIRYRTSVRNVEGPDSHPAAVRGNGPGLQVLWLLGVFGKARLVGKGRLDVGKPYPGEDGHPIPLVEAMVRNLVAWERIEWKLFVLALGFLHQQHINIKAGESRRHSIHAGADGVYVPVSNAHACYITKKSPGFSAGRNDVGDVPEIQVWYTD